MPPTVLRLERRNLDVNGKPASVFGIAQPDGTQGIVTQVGARFRVRVDNTIDGPSLIHWHGLTPPWQQDGVPGVSGPPIPAGGSADYDFPLRFGGTFWMHSHEGLQEQLLMAAPLIIRDQRDRPDQQEIVLMLADFSFTPPEEILAEPQEGRQHGRPWPTPLRGAGGMAGAKGAGMSMAAAKPDLNDVTYDAFLANDRTLGRSRSDQGRARRAGAAAHHQQLVDERFSYRSGRARRRTDRRRRICGRAGRGAALSDRGGAAARYSPSDSERVRGLSGAGRCSRAGTNKRVSSCAPAMRRSRAFPTRPRRRRRRLRSIWNGGCAPRRRCKPRKADRRHTLNLTGTMAGYSWSLNNVVWTPETPPLPVAQGERVELLFVNQTPMPHPMHLHGHEFQVVEINEQKLSGAVRDTVLVPPGHRVVIAFDANNPGTWALHCHLLYHLATGNVRRRCVTFSARRDECE